MPDPIVEVTIKPNTDSLRLQWGMTVTDGHWNWPHKRLEVRLYCTPFPDLGKPELLSMPLSDRSTTKVKSVETGFSLPFVELVSFGGGASTETTRSAFVPGTIFADAEGRCAPLHFQFADEDIPAGGVICYPAVSWPVTEADWLATPRTFRVVFGYSKGKSFEEIDEYTFTYPDPTTTTDDTSVPEPDFTPTPEMLARPRSQSKLFISYKRGTDGVQKLMDRLRDERYALWFDRDDINLGDADWQYQIQQGIWESAGVVLCLTPAACKSIPIQFEVKTALHFGKPVFPVMLDDLDDIGAGLVEIGLPERQHVERLTSRDDWEGQFACLLRGLHDHGIVVTRHDLRRVRGEAEYSLHQKYLSNLIERVGRLSLAAINPDHTDAEGAKLEDIYVSLPTGLTLAVEVKDYRAQDWWINTQPDSRERFRRNRAEDVDKHPESQHTRPQDRGWTDEAALTSLVDGYQSWLDERKAEVEAAQAKGERFYVDVDDGVYPDAINLDAQDIAAACPRLVVLGGPGSGKSTFVKHLALCLAGAERENWTRTAGLDQLSRWPHGALTPVYVELRAFVSSAHFPDALETMPTAADLWAYIRHEVLGDELADYAGALEDDLREGRALLILDGLDEVPYPRGRGNLEKRQEQLKALARSLDDTYGQTRILVASRPYAYEGWTLPGFEAVELAPFSNQRRIQLAANLYRVEGDDATAQDKAKRLNNALRGIDPELKDTPLFITLMASIFALGEEEGLPTRKGALYRESVLLLLERWTTAKTDAPSLAALLGDASRDDLLDRLGMLAYDVHDQLGDQPGTPEIPRHLIAQHIFEMQLDDPSVQAAQLVAYLSENAGVLVSPGHDQSSHVFHFAHRTFQEYLSARRIHALCQQSYGPVREHIEERPQLWRMPCLLVDDVVVDDAGTTDDLWELIDHLLPDDVPEQLNADDPRCWSVWLASQVIEEHDIYSGRLGRGDRAIRDHLREWLLEVSETPGALAPTERAGCGRAMSLIGDTRPGVGCVVLPSPSAAVGRGGGGEGILVPDIYRTWCSIPAGTFLMGSDKEQDPQAKDNETPQHEQTIAYDFRMAKYLVTYQQFQAFIDSGEYKHDDWWAGFPEKYQPQPMSQQINPHANHPRDSVSWYQAVAFTRWLTAKYREAGIIAENEEIRLPTEIEWEYAARGSDGRIYPYGDAFDATKGNTPETGIGSTSAVGLFPDPALPHGLLDMSGNLWEWCLNKYHKYQEPEIIKVDSSNDYRSLRGGAFFDLSYYSRCASRLNLNPSGDNHDLGLRVVVCAL